MLFNNTTHFNTKNIIIDLEIKLSKNSEKNVHKKFRANILVFKNSIMHCAKFSLTHFTPPEVFFMLAGGIERD